MARNIKLSQLGNVLEGQLETLLRATVLEADKQLKEKSPVDTGRFRMSWQVGENDNSGEPAPEGNYGGRPAPIKGSNYTPGREKLGNTYSVHNNLPYAEPLADGHSPQAPAGWVDLVSKDLQNYVKSEYERIKKQS